MPMGGAPRGSPGLSCTTILHTHLVADPYSNGGWRVQTLPTGGGTRMRNPKAYRPLSRALKRAERGATSHGQHTAVFPP